MRKLPDYSLVKREARSLLNKYGFETPPVDPVTIARNEGISVKFASFDGEFNNVSGFFDPSESAIYVNEDEYPLRQTFTIAHELGHYVLHREWATSDKYKIFWRDPDLNDRSDPHEKEANAFAAHLLVPRFMLNQYYDENQVGTLSKLFAVSVPVIKNRLEFEYGI